MKRKSLKVNAALNGIKSILSLLFPLITFPYVSRVLGANGIGIYNFSNSIVSYFILIAGLGVNTYAVREGAKYRDNFNKISKFSSEVFSINLVSTLIAYILLLLSLIVFSNLRNYFVCIAIFSLQIFFTTIGTEWIYTIFEDYAYITLRSIAFNIISVLLLFLFVRSKNDYLQYAAITVFAAVGSNVFNYIHAKKIVSIKFSWHLNLKCHLKPILIIFASSVAVMIYVNSDITLLGIMKNSYVVGIYSVSAKIYSIVKSVITALLVVTVPRLALLWGQHRFKEYKMILSDVINNLIILVLPCMVGLIMLSKEVILIISGKGFLRAQSSLQILCVALVFSLFGWIISDCVLIPAKREKKFFYATCISAIVNILINVLFIPSLAENAAAVSTVIAECSMMLMNLYYSWDIVNDIFRSKSFYRNLFSSVIGCIGIIFVCYMSDLEWRSLFFKIVFSVTLSVIIYGAILIALDNNVAKKVLQNLKNIKH